MTYIKLLKDNANSIDKSILAARLYNDKKLESDLMKSQLILLKLAQHLQSANFDMNDIKNLELDIMGVLEN